MRNCKHVLKIMVMTFLMVCMLSVVSSAANYYVTNTTVNMRAKAGTNSKVVLELPKECVVNVTSTSNSKWYKVTYRNNAQKVFKGYIYSKYLQKANLYKTTASLNLRSGANGPLVKAMPKGATVIVVNPYNGNWYKCVYFASNGNVYRGFAYQEYLQKKGASKGKYVTTDSVYMHKGPSIDSANILVVPKGKTVNVTNISHGKWYYASYKASNGKTYKGYISNLILRKK